MTDSESDDDFLSADEGDDVETTGSCNHDMNTKKDTSSEASCEPQDELSREKLTFKKDLYESHNTQNIDKLENIKMLQSDKSFDNNDNNASNGNNLQDELICETRTDEKGETEEKGGDTFLISKDDGETDKAVKENNEEMKTNDGETVNLVNEAIKEKNEEIKTNDGETINLVNEAIKEKNEEFKTDDGESVNLVNEAIKEKNEEIKTDDGGSLNLLDDSMKENDEEIKTASAAIEIPEPEESNVLSEKISASSNGKTESNSKLTIEKELPCQSVSSSSNNSEDLLHTDSNIHQKRTVSDGLTAEKTSCQSEKLERKSEEAKCKETPNNSASFVSKTEDSSNSWGWDSWADDFIAGAATKVSTLLETVEGQLGIPDPAEMAKTVTKEKDSEKEKISLEASTETKDKQSTQTPAGGSSWFSSFAPSLSNIVQPLGQELVSGGIDALEFLGKKTVSMISEGDPGLREKRKNMFEKQTLSSVLKEARDTSGVALQNNEKENITFESMFDKFQGVAHLDGLKLISDESDTKLNRILRLQSDEVKEEATELMESIFHKFNLTDTKFDVAYEGDFKKDIFSFTKKLKLKVTCSKLLNTWTKLKEKVDEIENQENIYQNSLSVLAEFLSRCIEFHRKIGDMLLITEVAAKDMCIIRAEQLKLITESCQLQISQLTKLFVDLLVEQGGDEVSQVITELYLECSNCQSLLQESHNLLLPVVQCSAIK